jgi:hypothetical protein
MISIIIISILVILIIYVVIYNNNEQYTQQYDEHIYTPDELYEHLNFISTFLSKHNIKHWIMFGTLLGGVRENDIISYDYDFDLGSYVENVDKIISLNSELEGTGYRFYLPENQITDSEKIWRVSIKIEYNGIIMGDIYLFHKCDDGFMRRYDPNSKIYFTPNITFPSWFIDELDNVELRKTKFPAPRDSVILLKHWYGDTWNIPIKAKAQGGTGDPNSDYYGMSKLVKLDNLTSYLGQKQIFVKPKMQLPIKYIFPPEQKDWINVNE